MTSSGITRGDSGRTGDDDQAAVAFGHVDEHEGEDHEAAAHRVVVVVVVRRLQPRAQPSARGHRRRRKGAGGFERTLPGSVEVAP